MRVRRTDARRYGADSSRGGDKKVKEQRGTRLWNTSVAQQMQGPGATHELRRAFTVALGL